MQILAHKKVVKTQSYSGCKNMNRNQNEQKMQIEINANVRIEIKKTRKQVQRWTKKGPKIDQAIRKI